MTKDFSITANGITFNLSVDTDTKQGSIGSNAIEGEDPNPEYEAAIDAIESLILAHACSGIPVTCPEYIEGIYTTLEALANNL
jgi:hypothetical protein